MLRLAYRILRLSARVAAWGRRRFTPAGWLALVAAVLGAAAGVDTRTSLAYQLFCLCVALLAVAWVATWRLRRVPAVNRLMPRLATAGLPLRYTLEIGNVVTRGPIDGLELLEDISGLQPDATRFAAAAPARAGISLVAAARHWQTLVAQRTPLGLDLQPLPPLAPGERRRLQLELTPQCRGRLQLAGVWLARRDPLGLMRALRYQPLAHSVLVLPRRFVLPRLGLAGTRVHQPGGVTLASSVGDSEEFQGLRDYRPGDPLQHVHWKSFARTGRPIVKEYESEFFERHALVLDGCTGGDGAVLECAVSVAASFACTVDTQESLLDLLFVAGRERCLTAGRGQLHADALLEVLALVEAVPAQRFAGLASAVLERRALLSSCILVLCGWDDARAELVRGLRASGLPLLVLSVLDDAGVSLPAWVQRVRVGQAQHDLTRLAGAGR